ncbi:helix-turn-helix transcriptional regulator [Parabacteroides distasonis]|nr:helix-turn-helix transcriptional regulator [Parabacteroides distasonis]
MKQLNRIKVVLVEQNRTAKWLSEQIGKNTCSSVSRWCTNTSQPDLETLFRIAEVLNVDVRELLYVEKKNNSTYLQ